MASSFKILVPFIPILPCMTCSKLTITYHVTIANNGLILEVHKGESKTCSDNVIIAQNAYFQKVFYIHVYSKDSEVSSSFSW